jgi:DNA excision repair protein ERCC-6
MAEQDDEAAQLAELATGVRDQEDLERDIGRQADELLLKQADERDQKRLDKTQKSRDRLDAQVRRLEHKLTEFGNHATKTKLRADLEQTKQQIQEADNDLDQIRQRIDERHRIDPTAQQGDSLLASEGSNRLPGESHREFLIRTGKITPFSKVGGSQLQRTSSSLGDVLMDAEQEEEDENAAEEEIVDGTEMRAPTGPVSHRNLLAPGFEAESNSTEADAEMARRLQEEEFASERPAKRRRLQSRQAARSPERPSANTDADDSDAGYVPETDIDAAGKDADSEESQDEEAYGDFALDTAPSPKRPGRKSKKERAVQDAATPEDLTGIDDGNETVYKRRLNNWVDRRSSARKHHRESQRSAEEANPPTVKDEATSDQLEHVPDHEDEWHLPHPTRSDTVLEGGLRIPGDIYPALFDYQKTGVQWLWELYSQQTGGIIGDEMGLGKTVQVISFLAGLHYSRKVTKPIIVVCPATVMQQWVNEFHRWWPPLRVSILHTSGSGMLDVKREARIEDDLEELEYNQQKKLGKAGKAAKRIVDKVARDGHVLVTTYSGLQTYAELLIPTEWEYAVLDEGHKIRNPNTAITIYTKELRTHNRLILSGTPMQNNLTELWSLFDFVFPMRLGTLVDFRNQFEIPIKLGGYANASNLQVETAMHCAETLKDAISPYLLQRFKIDVAADLPKKSERVLFCKLTKLQLETYQSFLNSEEMTSIMNGKRQALYGIDILRKICNHPDLVEHKTLSKRPGYAYGNGAKSGKMQVVKALLEIWKRNGHKTLLFAQHRIMLDILEEFIKGMDGFNYLRMDGNTSIKDRQDLVDDFNNNPDLHVFLLTTKVGGLGVNLTGANRVIIYDPDWNPSTDIQARERAWRLGQKREVEIYRLMTAGTIEEKIYHRQIFKQFLTNKILRDPKQRQTFQLKDLHDLFTLGGTEDGQTETGNMFKNTEVQLSVGKDAVDENDAADSTSPNEPEKQRTLAEMSTITGISRQEDFRGNPDEEKRAAQPDEQGEHPQREDRVLSSIFARTGVHSALEHDDIMNGGRQTLRADPAIIAREAKRVAAEAARELQRSATIARTIPAGVPTWTGQVGSSGRPEERLPSTRGRGGMRGGRGGGPSSASVLANLQSRQGGSASSSRASTPAGRGRDQPKGQDFLVLIRDFLRAHGGSAPTQMLVDHFNRYCGTEQRTAEFREMLKAIARLEKGSRGRGSWVLKEEYRT